MATIDVIHEDDRTPGWAPVHHLAMLAARLLGGERLTFGPGHPSRLERLVSLRPRQRRGSTGRSLLAILMRPSSLYSLRHDARFRQGYDRIGVWVIDSFWHEQVPHRQAFNGIDFVAVMRPNDAEVLERASGRPVLVLPWGADVLDLGTDRGVRPVDVLRVGRQPPAWNDDAASARSCEAAGLRFAGRPPFSSDPAENQRNMLEAYAGAKFVLAHTNRAGTDDYTHPREEYITARWTDALAAGATVAGVQPRSDLSMDAVLWPEATLDFDRVDLAHNVAALREATAGWSPERAALNHRKALERLDWRRRLEELARQFGAAPSALAADLARLDGRIADLAPAQARRNA